MSTVIKVENLSKQYRLGNVGSGSLKDDLTRWWNGMRGKEDPLLQIGDTNDRSQKADSDYVWALKDINFEVQQGDVLGIIGRNGAGKSTLLKILSKTTAPTTGNVKVKGRIASLLEVGTGFHPELTGRENIYLNGAILGMRKHEITRKLDEIIDFAGVERYIDTPVKRYSSGMYVRLAFGVAAHLESEILIIDEVLAVGDAEFQKKCLGKMSDVSKGEGRTVLFVSHNMQAVQKLCNRAINLNKGIIDGEGATPTIINQHLKKEVNESLNVFIEPSTYKEEQLKSGYAESVLFEDLHGHQLTSITVGKYFKVRIRFRLFKTMEHFIIGIGISTVNEVPVYTAWSKAAIMEQGTYEAVFINDELLFATGDFRLTIGLSNNEKTSISVARITSALGICATVRLCGIVLPNTRTKSAQYTLHR
jgi:ABC-type polysaccharide/polyol phosphate transport system ATPase subunit